MARKMCMVMGAVLLIVGILGFAQPDLLGMHLTPVHNVIHLVSGGAALYLAQNGSRGSVRQFCLIFGGLYLSLAVLGVLAPDVVAAMLGHDAHLNAGAGARQRGARAPGRGVPGRGPQGAGPPAGGVSLMRVHVRPEV